MNRNDLIQAKARDIASNVHIDPVARDAMADALIELVGMVLGAVGKAVAIEGEQQVNEVADWVFELDTESIDYSDAEVAEKDAEFAAEQNQEAAKAHNRYLLGEQIQTAATEAVASSVNRLPGARGRGQGVDLERWHRQTPGDPCRCGHSPQVHQEGKPCNGQDYNGEACKGGRCDSFVRAEPTGGWVHVDRRPVARPERIALRDVAMDGTERVGRVATLAAPAAPATADDELPLGTVVYRDHEEISVARQGIVLGPWPGARNDRVVVWWPEFGTATPDTLQWVSGSSLVAAGTLDSLSPQRLLYLRGSVGFHDVAAPLIRALDVALGATDRNSADDCCHGDAPCPWSKVKAGGCCFPKNAVCPLHH